MPPPRVVWFYWRARRRARRAGDDFSLQSATRLGDMAKLVRLARGRARVAEVGTGSAWTSIALALDEPRREVVTYDPVAMEERELYLDLVPPAVGRRIRFVERPGVEGARTGEPVEMVFIDSSHERDATIAEFAAWRQALRPGAIVAFHDYEHPVYPGVTEAVAELGLTGEVHGSLFVWRAPA